MKPPKRPRDPNQLAKMIVDLSTGQIADEADIQSDEQKLARAGGLKGGPARREALPPERRKEIAQKAAKARWESSGT